MTISYTIHTFEDQTCICKWVDGEHSGAIPYDPENTDYAEYLEWVAEGNKPQPAD